MDENAYRAARELDFTVPWSRGAEMTPVPFICSQAKLSLNGFLLRSNSRWIGAG